MGHQVSMVADSSSSSGEAERCSTIGGYRGGCSFVGLCLCAVISITTRFSAMPSSFLVQHRLHSRLQLMIV